MNEIIQTLANLLLLIDRFRVFCNNSDGIENVAKPTYRRCPRDGALNSY